MSEHKQCFICGRVGTRGFTAWPSGGWSCSAVQTCRNRRRAEQASLRQAVQEAVARQHQAGGS